MNQVIEDFDIYQNAKYANIKSSIALYFLKNLRNEDLLKVANSIGVNSEMIHNIVRMDYDFDMITISKIEFISGYSFIEINS